MSTRETAATHFPSWDLINSTISTPPPQAAESTGSPAQHLLPQSFCKALHSRLIRVTNHQRIPGKQEELLEEWKGVKLFLLGNLDAMSILLSSPEHLPSILIRNSYNEAESEQTDERSSDEATRRWQLLCVLAESIWWVASDQDYQRKAPPIALPLAARFRFQVLSFPFRCKGAGMVDSTFGIDSETELVARCHEARSTWLRQLDEYDKLPELQLALTDSIEEELTLLIFQDEDKRHVLQISRTALKSTNPPSATDTAIAYHVVTHHFLPRFAIGQVMRIAFNSQCLVIIGALTALLALLSPVALFIYSPEFGGFTAVATYGSIAVFTWRFHRLWATPWLMRVPAAGTLGIFLILALPSYWWENASWDCITIIGTLGLVVAPALYLLMQATNHNVRSRAIRRVVLITIIAAVHSWLITLIGLTFLMPIFADNGHDFLLALKSSWQTQLAILLPAAAFNFSVGVFTQILWEDRPITAPLAHASWNESR